MLVLSPRLIDNRLMVKRPNLKINLRQLLAVIILVIALYVVLPQIGQFNDSWRLVKQAELAWVGLAAVFIGGTYFAAAATYCFLSFKPIPYFLTMVVQLAAMFINRLLPAGVGAIGANFAYLRHYKHSNAQAGSIVAINNTLGMLGHTTLLAAAGLTGASQIDIAENGSKNETWLIAAIALVVGATVLVLLLRNKRKLHQALLDLRAQLGLYARKPWRLPLGLCSSMTLTLCNVMALTVCAAALGVEMSFISMLLVFSAGVAAGTVTPTPGGLGGFEAGLVAAFVASGIDGATALAVALLFRLISYWLPMIVGGVTFFVVQRRGVFSR